MEIHIFAIPNECDEFIKLIHDFEKVGYKQTFESSSIDHFYCKLEREKENTNNI